MAIESQNPAVLDSTYPIWSVPVISIFVPPDAPAGVRAAFRRSRNTGVQIGGDLVTVLGEPKMRHELLEQGPEARARVLEIEDIDALARERMLAGDARWAQAIGLITELLREEALARGVIS